MSITPEQVISARKLLGWTKMRLAARSNQSEAAVALLEADQRRPDEQKVQAIREALENAGIEFGEAGVTMPGEKADLRAGFKSSSGNANRQRR